MAVIISDIVAGLMMAESPIVLTAKVESRTFDSDMSSGRAILRLCRGNSYSSVAYEEISFGAENDRQYDVDISSAVRALLNKSNARFDPNGDSGQSLPSVTYCITPGFSYMKSGQLYVEMSSNTSTGHNAIFGALTDAERRTHGGKSLSGNISTLSRKPSSDYEMVPAGMRMFYTTLSDSTPVVSQSVLTGTSGSMRHWKFWADRFNDYRQFVFMNSVGGVDSAAARCLESNSVNVQRSNFVRVGRPSNVPNYIDSTMSVGGKPYDVFAMSSGPVPAEWAEWWTKEFLQAKRMWMLVGGVYVPCSVTPAKQDVQVYSKSKSDAQSVEFNVRVEFTSNSSHSIVQ